MPKKKPQTKRIRPTYQGCVDDIAERTVEDGADVYLTMHSLVITRFVARMYGKSDDDVAADVIKSAMRTRHHGVAK